MKTSSQNKRCRESFRLNEIDVSYLQLLSKVKDRGNKSRYIRRSLEEALLALLPSIDDSWSTPQLTQRLEKARKNVALREQPEYRELTNDLPLRAAHWLRAFNAAVAELAEAPFSDEARKSYRLVMTTCPEELM